MAGEAVFNIERTEIKDCVFRDISLRNNAFLGSACAGDRVSRCHFESVFTDRADMILFDCEETEGSIFKRTIHYTVLDEDTCTGLDMINVIKQ